MLKRRLHPVDRAPLSNLRPIDPAALLVEHRRHVAAGPSGEPEHAVELQVAVGDL